MIIELSKKNESWQARKIVFPHIMKTGGSSLIVWIQRHYHFNEILLSSTWPDFLRQPANYVEKKSFVRGHFGSRILDLFNEAQGFSSIAMVRDPVARVLSHFWHLKKAPDVPSDLLFVRDEGFRFEDFVDHSRFYGLVSNYQVANYSGVSGGGRNISHGNIAFNEYSGFHSVTDSDLDHAKAFIDRCAVVGVTENMPAFIDALCAFFGFYRDYSLPRHRAYQEEMDVSPAVLSRVRELNVLDKALYDHVKARCDAQLDWQFAREDNPNKMKSDGVFYWRAGMPFFGSGWDDVMDLDPPHIWSILPASCFVINAEGFCGGTLIFSIFRFCVEIQERYFEVFINGRVVAPVRVNTNADGATIFAVAIPFVDLERLVLTFKLNLMVSFSDIDQGSNDSLPRGIALVDIRVFANKFFEEDHQGREICASDFDTGARQEAIEIDVQYEDRQEGIPVVPEKENFFAGVLSGAEKSKIFSRSVPDYSWTKTPKVFSSTLCREQHFRLPLYEYWCRALKESPRFHRKQWEFVFICQVLHERGFLRSGMSAIGFGVGKEPLASYFSSRGVRVLATDLELSKAAELGWTSTNQHADSLGQLNERALCSPQDFYNLASFRNVDMNHIPEDIGEYDICWSSCAFEHLGSIRKGLDFVRNSARLLLPGGIAVHTTEYNLSSNSETLDNDPSFVIFRRCDIEMLVEELASEGYQVEPIDFASGSDDLERYVDLPPYVSEPHLRLKLAEKYVATSLGIIIRNGNIE